MKTLLIIFSLAMVGLGFKTSGEIGYVIEGMRYGNAEQVAAYFDSNAELVFSGENISVTDRKQALKELQLFFSAHSVKNFEVIHRGENTTGEYCIGQLLTRNGAFRTTLFMKKNDRRMTVHSLKFEK